MTLSPTAILLWAVLSSLLLIFLIMHLYRYDKFQCLAWSSGRQPGAFKRIMTYSYLLTVPLLVIFSLAMTSIKYSEGYVQSRRLGFIPRPVELWDDSSKAWYLPLFIIFAISWALEMVTHLEELNFWLFILRQGPVQRNWFESAEFRTWAVGSILALAGMPIVPIITRSDYKKIEAWVFFCGSVGSLIITLAFLYVVWQFPSFLRRVRTEGADGETLVRLTAFQELNIIRILFRFMFVVPLFILAVDGIKPGSHHINENTMWSDIFAVLGGIGCIVSSMITLMIFFPRSYATEVSSQPSHAASIFSAKTVVHSPTSATPFRSPSPTSGASTKAERDFEMGQVRPGPHPTSPLSVQRKNSTTLDPQRYSTTSQRAVSKEAAEMKTDSTNGTLPRYIKVSTRLNANRTSASEMPPVHPLAMTYRSPIDLFDAASMFHQNRGVPRAF